MAILHGLEPTPNPPQTAAWQTRDGDDLILVRQYADGTHTIERKVGRHYTGEAVLVPVTDAGLVAS